MFALYLERKCSLPFCFCCTYVYVHFECTYDNFKLGLFDVCTVIFFFYIVPCSRVCMNWVMCATYVV